jgi:TRAP-type uncharacterized transport system fused permease subunit
MAEFLAVPYAQVALWAVVPSLLYYLAVFFAVHFEAKRYRLSGVPEAELPRFAEVILRRGHMFLPILIVLPRPPGCASSAMSPRAGSCWGLRRSRRCC